MNIKLSLGAVQDILSAGLDVRDIVHNSKSDGSGTDVISTMAVIPKFKTSGWPQAALNDLEVGGFMVDVYEASQPDATSISRGSTTADTPGTVAACSRPGVTPWTDISWQNARIAASNRVVQGRNCHMTTPFERFAILAWIMKSGNWGRLRGNNVNGKDLRDAASWENYGTFDPTRPAYRLLTGTGPASFWSSGIPGRGLHNLVGNVYEWEDCRLESGLYQPKAYLAGARLAADTYIDYDDNALGDGVNVCQLTPGVYTITDAVNGDEDVTVSRVIITGRFSGRLILSSGMTLAHGDDCAIQLKTAVDVSSAGTSTSTSKAIGALLDDATGRCMALPNFADTTTHVSTYLDSGYIYNNSDSRVLGRGGNWNSGANARAGLFVKTYYSPTYTTCGVGFRAALSFGNL